MHGKKRQGTKHCKRPPLPECLYEGPPITGTVDGVPPGLAPGVLHPAGAIHPLQLLRAVAVRLREVDQGGVGEYGHQHQHQQQAQLLGTNGWSANCDQGYLVSLLQGVEQGLEPGKVTNQLEDSQDPHHSHLTKF